MADRGHSQEVQKVMEEPIILRYLQKSPQFQTWLFEQAYMQMERCFIGFAEHRNLRLDGVEEVCFQQSFKTAPGLDRAQRNVTTLLQSVSRQKWSMTWETDGRQPICFLKGVLCWEYSPKTFVHTVLITLVLWSDGIMCCGIIFIKKISDSFLGLILTQAWGTSCVFFWHTFM